MDTMELYFTKEKETKNTVRYQEQIEELDIAVGALYVQKDALGSSYPEKLKVTIEEV